MKRLNADGLKMITKHEGLRLKAYQDSGGKWTIGYGHTATARPGMTITQAQAVRLLEKDIERFEDCVMDTITAPLTQDQFNALVSFAFNRGCGGFKKSRFVALINAGKFEEAADVWLTTATTVKGRPLRGLQKRRKDEVAMFSRDANERTIDLAQIGRFMFFGSLRAATRGRV